jgi:hypothetical protein
MCTEIRSKKSCGLQNLLSFNHFNEQFIPVKSQLLVIPLRCVDTSLLFFTAGDYSCGMNRRQAHCMSRFATVWDKLNSLMKLDPSFRLIYNLSYVERGGLHTINQKSVFWRRRRKLEPRNLDRLSIKVSLSSGIHSLSFYIECFQFCADCTRYEISLHKVWYLIIQSTNKSNNII